MVRKIRITQAQSGDCHIWREIYGTAPYPLTGEDAQTWAKRTRHEANATGEKRNFCHQKFDAFMPNMHNISIPITFQKLPLRTNSLAEAYS